MSLDNLVQLLPVLMITWYKLKDQEEFDDFTFK